MKKWVFVLATMLLGAAMLAAVACGGEEPEGEPSFKGLNAPTAEPAPALTEVACEVTEGFALELPVLIGRGEDPIPSGFDAGNIAFCSFDFPVVSATLALVRGGRIAFTQQVPVDPPATQVSFPVAETPADPVPATLETGSYDHRISVIGDGGQEVEVLAKDIIYFSPDSIWVLDPTAAPVQSARLALTAARTSLEAIPLNTPLRVFEPVEWPDAALGCPEPGILYAQVVTPGFRLVFEHQGQRHEYHTNQDGSLVVAC